MGRIVVTQFIYFKYPNWSFEFERGTEGEQFKKYLAHGLERGR